MSEKGLGCLSNISRHNQERYSAAFLMVSNHELPGVCCSLIQETCLRNSEITSWDNNLDSESLPDAKYLNITHPETKNSKNSNLIFSKNFLNHVIW